MGQEKNDEWNSLIYILCIILQRVSEGNKTLIETTLIKKLKNLYTVWDLHVESIRITISDDWLSQKFLTSGCG